MSIKVTVWNEFRHERENEDIKKVYSDGIHMTIEGFLEKNEEVKVHTSTLDEAEHGLSDEVLKNTDILIWWAHKAHGEVRDEIVEIHGTRPRGIAQEFLKYEDDS